MTPAPPLKGGASVARLYRFDFACNDPDNGLFAGKVASAQWDDCEIEAPNWEGYTFAETPNGIRIHRRTFIVQRSKEWIGNWCWNGYWMERAEWKRLLLTLRENGWRCTCGPCRFYDWFNREREAA